MYITVNVAHEFKTFGTFVYSKLQHFIFNNYERQRAKVFKLVKTNYALDFLTNNASSARSSEGIIFDKIQGIVISILQKNMVCEWS